MILETIAERKRIYEDKMRKYKKRIRDQMRDYGSIDCEYLANAREHYHYYRGARNALNELEKLL